MKRKRSTCAKQSQTNNTKNDREKLPALNIRYDRYDHLPVFDPGNSVRCKMPKCALKSVFYCMKCNVHLCIKSKNCFQDFHTIDCETSSTQLPNN